MPTWNAGQYLKFGEERTQPCRDLAARILVSKVDRVMDLGCGPGNSTKVLSERWPQAALTGLDNSPEMIEAARAAGPGHWVVGDIAKWAEGEAGKFDVVFSNAALHWVPDHAVVYPRLLARTADAGALAVQVPANFNAPAHQLMREMASSPAWRARLPIGRVREWHTQDFTFYYDLLAPLCERVDIWETEYVHVLRDASAVVEWYKGSGMRPFLDALDSDSAREEFEKEYLEGIRKLYLPRGDGRILFPFRRSFLIAYR